MEICDCYRVKNRPILTGSSAFGQSYEICIGTKEFNECSCGGDPAKCNFYPEKIKETKKTMNTAEMWLKAQEDGKTYISEDADAIYSKKLDLVDINDINEQIDVGVFLSFDDFMNSNWTEMKEKIMTKDEAEKKFGIRIVEEDY